MTQRHPWPFPVRGAPQVPAQAPAKSAGPAYPGDLPKALV